MTENPARFAGKGSPVKSDTQTPIGGQTSPLPFYVSFGRKRCMHPTPARDDGCGRKFWRMETYELHYRLEHQTRPTTPGCRCSAPWVDPEATADPPCCERCGENVTSPGQEDSNG